MGRARHQDGWVEERGKKRKTFYGHYFVRIAGPDGKDIRRHIGVKLGTKSEIRKWEAEAKLRSIIASATKVAPRTEDQTLRWFMVEKFLPMKAPSWQPSTCATNKGNIDNRILPALGNLALTAIGKFECQMFLNGLAEKNYSRTVVEHCRIMLKAALEEALEADLIGKNPARKLDMPSTREVVKAVLPKTDARVLLEALGARDRLIMMIGAFCAMRPGEIFGLKWSSWQGDSFLIEGTAWRGQLKTTAKTRQSKAPVAIPDLLLAAVQEWRKENSQAPLDSLMFPNEKGRPMRPENWLRRRVKPIANRLGISCPVHFQVLRRTFATNAQAFCDPKGVQSHLRHASITTTMDEYTQPVTASTRKLVNQVAEDVMKARVN